MNFKKYFSNHCPGIDVNTISDEEYKAHFDAYSKEKYTTYKLNKPAPIQKEKSNKQIERLKKKQKIKEDIILEKAKKIVERQSEIRKIAYENRGKNSHLPDNYRSYISRANAKKIAFKLTLEEFNELIARDCTYCGGTGGGIDRIQPGGGYTVENATPCCFRCNTMKYTYPVDDFLRHIKKVYRFINP